MNINNVNTTTAPREPSPKEISPSRPFQQDARDNAPLKINRGQKPEDIAKTAAQKARNTEQEEKPGSTGAMEELTEELNEYMDDLQTNLGFNVKKDMKHQVVVEIKNRKTDELVKQIPSEELLKIKEKMEELTGLLFDKKV